MPGVMHMWIAGLISGALVGLVLGVVGGGGSIFAVPLLIYFVGVASTHVAIGTSAVAVAVSAAINLVLHARHGTVKWRCATVFAAAGAAGAWVGSTLGKATDGRKLLALFGAIMVVIGVLTLLRRGADEKPDVHLDMDSAGYLAPRLLVTGLGAGVVAGFFGIGGGFLIVPSLMFATRMPMIAAIGSSLVAVTIFGLATATNYATSGLVDWQLAAVFVAGGLLGGSGGTRLAVMLAGKRRVLSVAFAALVIGVGIYIFVTGVPALIH
jgi:uncharacterized protein